MHYHTDVSALTAGSQLSELLLCFLQGLCMGTNVISILAPSQRKAQKLKISDCYRVGSGLSPSRTCAHRAHSQQLKRLSRNETAVLLLKT